MGEGALQTSPDLQFDVSVVACLRKRVAHAATSLKSVGFLSSWPVFAYLSQLLR
jgi:hypothetical protein